MTIEGFDDYIQRRTVAGIVDDLVIRDTDVRVSHVLHLMSVHLSGEVVRARTPRYGEVSSSALRACAAYAREVVQSRSIRPPVGAAFVERWRQRGIDVSVERAIPDADRVLDSFLRGRDSFDDPTEARQAAIGFSYAAAAVRNGRLPYPPPDDDRMRRQLSKDDLERTDDFFVYRSEIASYRMTPEVKVVRWRWFVARLGGVSGWDRAEIRNELVGRDILEQAIALVSPEGRTVYRKEIDPVDDDFYSSTSPSPTPPLIPETGWEPLRWWYYRRLPLPRS
jgi:uncharacterized protein (DUF433 family)